MANAKKPKKTLAITTPGNDELYFSDAFAALGKQPARYNIRPPNRSTIEK